MDDKYQIGKEYLLREEIKIRTMNFGQGWREQNVIDIPFRIRLPNQFVNDLINKELEEYKKDALLHPNKDSALEQLLEKENWPEAPEVFTKNSELTNELLEYYSHELLLEWFRESQTDRIKFVINKVADIRIDQEYTTIAGYGRNADTSTKYQDS